MTIASKDKVSIILPFFNGKEYIFDAICSITNQSFSNFEVLIIDDGSTNIDHSTYLKDLVNDLKDDRVKYISKENSGLSNTRNYGVANSIGEYIAFIDQDDVWVDDKLEKQVEILNNYPEIGLVCTDAKFIGDQSGRINLTEKHNITPGLVCDSYTQMLRSNFVVASSACFRRSVALSNSGSNSGYRVCPDYELFLRFSANTNFFLLSEPLVYYRWHEGNTVRNVVRMELELIRMFRSIEIRTCYQALISYRRIIFSVINLMRYSLINQIVGSRQ